MTVHPNQRPIRFKKKYKLPQKKKKKCGYCGRRLSGSNSTVDHMNPKALGGELTKEENGIRGSNLIACCRLCNTAKGCMRYEDWMDELFQVRLKFKCDLYLSGFRLGPDGSFMTEPTPGDERDL
ncbi:HNH endonuclease [Candidatus Pacearchaeota archaeon]|nr:HNH endonuclease [Candidatus Pacearchaeota archaeon]